MRLGLAVKVTLGIVRRLMNNGAFESDLEELFQKVYSIETGPKSTYEVVK